ncbi:MAG: hypothetical protein JXA53_06510 [Bacteroidales bacterium]|nr:hypothetical protein [Bacteroidales bacterium]
MNNLGQTLILSLNSKISAVEDKVEKLLSENIKLKSENSKFQKSLLELQLENQALVNKNEMLKLSKTLNSIGESNSVESKAKITKIVREIDRCIALLNR